MSRGETNEKGSMVWLSAVGIFTVMMTPSAYALDDFDDWDIPTFITPSRMTTSYLDTPNSLSKLDAVELQLLGIYTIPDALRLVPGMLVSDHHGSRVSVGYHGSNVNVTRRMEILYNSQSLYRAGYSEVHWHRLLIDVPDLSSIEVVRGSSGTDFGSNAFTSTINFIQSPVASDPGLDVFNRRGSGDTNDTWIRNSRQFGQWRIDARYFQETNSGFDISGDDPDFRDSNESENFMMLAEYPIGNEILLEVTLAGNRSTYLLGKPPIASVIDFDIAEDLVNNAIQVVDSEEQSWIAHAKLSGHTSLSDATVRWSSSLNSTEFNRDQPMSMCVPNFMFDKDLIKTDALPNVHLELMDFPIAIATGFFSDAVQLDRSVKGPLTEDDRAYMEEMAARLRNLTLGEILEMLSFVCGETDQSLSERRTQLTFQAITELNERVSASSLFSVGYSDAESQTYLNGSVNRRSWSFANNVRTRVTNHLTANIGAMIEDNNAQNHPIFSTRLAFNYHRNNSVYRALWSESRRSLDIYETERNWTYLLRYEPGVTNHMGESTGQFFRRAMSPDNLKPEKIETFEVGYTYIAPLNKQVFDVKLFRENRRNLISEPFDYFEFFLTNEGQVHLQGMEFEFKHKFAQWSGASFGSAYSYIDHDTDTLEETTLYARHNGAVWSILPVAKAWVAGLGYYGNSAGYDRFDVTLTGSLFTEASDIVVQLNYRHYRDELSYISSADQRPDTIAFTNSDRITASLRVKF